MKYIKTMTQLKLSIWLALYIGWFMNAAVFFRRFEGYAQEFTIWKGLSGAVELIGTFLVTFFLLRILSLFGRRVWRILATIVVLVAMTFWESLSKRIGAPAALGVSYMREEK